MTLSKFAALAAVVSVSTILGACGSTQERASADRGGVVSSEGVVAQSATLRVDGLGCPMCAESIAILMDNIDGVVDSSVDLSSGEVKVELDGETPVSEAQLRSAIDDGGFTFRSVAFHSASKGG